jgi:hypothetical protein
VAKTQLFKTSDVFTFGKYKGKKINKILLSLRGCYYILWAINNVDFFKVTPKVKRLATWKISSVSSGQSSKSRYDSYIYRCGDYYKDKGISLKKSYENENGDIITSWTEISPSTGAVEKYSYNRTSKITTWHGGGPCGPMYYNEYGEEC